MDGDEGDIEKTQLLSDSEGSGSASSAEEGERELERLLSAAGYGFFHLLLLLVSSLATAADGVEVLGVGFVVPIAEEDLRLNTIRKGYLDASVFVGEC